MTSDLEFPSAQPSHLERPFIGLLSGLPWRRPYRVLLGVMLLWSSMPRPRAWQGPPACPSPLKNAEWEERACASEIFHWSVSTSSVHVSAISGTDPAPIGAPAAFPGREQETR